MRITELETILITYPLFRSCSEVHLIRSNAKTPNCNQIISTVENLPCKICLASDPNDMSLLNFFLELIPFKRTLHMLNLNECSVIERIKWTREIDFSPLH